MSKKVLIISSSLRVGSNSEILAHEVEQGALKAGNEVKFESLKNKNIQFCLGCLACQKNFKCVLQDDVAELIEKVQYADVIVFATPIYYYEMSGLLKTFLDRCNPLYSRNNQFMNVYLLKTSADDAEIASDGAVKGIEGWVSCFEQSQFAGVLACGGLEESKDAYYKKEYLEKAYQFGMNLK